MRIKEIEQYFQSEETLDKVLEACQEDFDKIDYYSGLLKQNVTDNPEEVKKALIELTGCYMSLYPVMSLSDSEKNNREVRAYCQIRIDTENAGGKFVDASAQKEASNAVSNYRRIRNILEGYTEASNRAISSLQSILKYLSEEVKRTGVKDE